MKTNIVNWIPNCEICGLPTQEITSTTGGVCRGHPNIEDELDDILKQFDIDALADYWKVLADKRLVLLKRVQDELSFCLYCDIEYLPGDGIERLSQHALDCELAEAIDGR